MSEKKIHPALRELHSNLEEASLKRRCAEIEEDVATGTLMTALAKHLGYPEITPLIALASSFDCPESPLGICIFDQDLGGHAPCEICGKEYDGGTD